MKPTQEQVIAWAREAGIPINWPGVMPYFEHFAALAYEAGRKDENEACAKVCEKLSAGDGFEWGYAYHCALQIRARKEQ